MLYGIGIDTLDLERISVLSPHWDDPFFTRTFTGKERMEAVVSKDPVRYYGKRFSGKEAVFKSLGMSPDDVRLNEIEILNRKDSKLVVNLSGKTGMLAADYGIRSINISFSSKDNFIVSIATSEY